MHPSEFHLLQLYKPEIQRDINLMYIRHRHFLKPHQPYRRLKKAFNGTQERETAPIPLTGE